MPKKTSKKGKRKTDTTNYRSWTLEDFEKEDRRKAKKKQDRRKKAKLKSFCVMVQSTTHTDLTIKAASEEDAKKRAIDLLHGVGWTEFEATNAWEINKE